MQKARKKKMKKLKNSAFLIVIIISYGCSGIVPEDQSSTQMAIVATSDAYKSNLHQAQDAVSTEAASSLFSVTATYEARRMVISPPVEVTLVSHDETNQVLAGDTIAYITAYEKNHWSLPYDKRAELREMYDSELVYYLGDGETVLLIEYYDGFAKFQFLRNRYSKKTGDIGWVRVGNIKSFATYLP